MTIIFKACEYLCLCLPERLDYITTWQKVIFGFTLPCSAKLWGTCLISLSLYCFMCKVEHDIQRSSRSYLVASCSCCSFSLTCAQPLGFSRNGFSLLEVFHELAGQEMPPMLPSDTVLWFSFCNGYLSCNGEHCEYWCHIWLLYKGWEPNYSLRKC